MDSERTGYFPPIKPNADILLFKNEKSKEIFRVFTNFNTTNKQTRHY